MTDKGMPMETSRDVAVDIPSPLIIDRSDLLAGDILLFRSLKPDIIAKRIQKATGSPYTHAAIYLGGGEFAESNLLPGVRLQHLSDGHIGGRIVGVLRSQLGFSDSRAEAVRDFIAQLVSQNAAYDFSGVRRFSGKNKQFFENILEEVAANYGDFKTSEEYLNQSYFCSALVVACYIVAGVIGDTAQAAYPPDVFSPGDLHRDDTFGWLLGFLVDNPADVPADDPLLTRTLWKDNLDVKWWE